MTVEMNGREPIALIEADGTRWDRVGPDAWGNPRWPGFTPSREKIERSTEGPIRELWSTPCCNVLASGELCDLPRGHQGRCWADRECAVEL